MFDSPDNMIYVLGCCFWLIVLAIGWAILKAIWNVIWGILKGIFSIFNPATYRQPYNETSKQTDDFDYYSRDDTERTYPSQAEIDQERYEQEKREEKWEEDSKRFNNWMWGDEKGFSHWFFGGDDDNDDD